MGERRAAFGFRSAATDVPGIVQATDGSVWVVAPDGSRSLASSPGPAGPLGPAGPVGPAGSALVSGNRTWGGGDSLMLRSGMTVPPLPTLGLNDNQPMAWAGLMSQQKIWIEGIAATGGYTTSDFMNKPQTNGLSWLQTLVAVKPSAAVILLGTNDISTEVAQATTLANYATIFTTLASAGILTGICSLLPRLAYLSQVHKLNAWLHRFALDNGFPLIDLYTVMVDPVTGGLKGQYDSGDGIHQNAAGAKVMGQTIKDALAPLLPPWNPGLPAANTDSSGINPNPLFLTDSSGDGVPDAWTIEGAGASSVLTTDPAVLGKVWQVTRGGTDLLLYSTLRTVPAGHVMEIVGRIKATLEASSAGIAVRATGGVLSREEAAPIGRAAALWKTDLDWSTFYSRYVVKADNPNARMQLDVKAGNGIVSLAQVIQRDLTALGLA